MKKKSKKFIQLCKKYGVDPDKVPEIMSVEAAFKKEGLDPKELPIVDHLPKKHQKRPVADYILTIVAAALGGGQPDHTNYNEWKYFARFFVKADKKRPSGFGLSYGGCGSWSAVSVVGVRLCFPTWDQAKFFGMHFLKHHIDHHLYT